MRCIFLLDVLKNRNRKVIVEKPSPSEMSGGDLELLCGRDILSNEQINALSVRTKSSPLPPLDVRTMSTVASHILSRVHGGLPSECGIFKVSPLMCCSESGSLTAGLNRLLKISNWNLIGPKVPILILFFWNFEYYFARFLC